MFSYSAIVALSPTSCKKICRILASDGHLDPTLCQNLVKTKEKSVWKYGAGTDSETSDEYLRLCNFGGSATREQIFQLALRAKLWKKLSSWSKVSVSKDLRVRVRRSVAKQFPLLDRSGDTSRNHLDPIISFCDQLEDVR